MSSYAFFVQTCREEHKKKHPGESVVFAEFSKKCAEKWKTMGGKEKKRFEEMAEQDKARYEREMNHYTPGAGLTKGGKRKKDPNAPKRALSAFFFFCNEERGGVKAAHPDWGIGEISKTLGKKWGEVTDKGKYESMAEKDKVRYAREMEKFKSGGSVPAKKAKLSPAKPPPPAVEEDSEDDDDDSEDEEEEEDDED